MARFVLALLASVVVHSVAAQTAEEKTFIVAVEGDRVELSCPSTVVYWELFQYQPDKIVDLTTMSDSSPSADYYCAGKMAGSERSCKQGISLNSTFGTPFVMANIEMDFGGEFSCFYTSHNETTVERQWDVTVLKYSPELSHQLPPNLDGQHVTETSVLPAGTNISVSCVYTYAGFTDPGVRLVVRNQSNSEQVLQSSPKRFDAVDITDEKSGKITAEYIVQQDDYDIDIICSICEQTEGNLATSKRFRGPGSPADLATSPGPNEFSTHAIIITTVLLATTFVVVTVAIVTMIRQKRNSRRQLSSDESRLLSRDGLEHHYQPVNRHVMDPPSSPSHSHFQSSSERTAPLMPAYFYNGENLSIYDDRPTSY